MGEAVSVIIIAIGVWGVVHPKSLQQIAGGHGPELPRGRQLLMQVVGLSLIAVGILTLFDVGTFR
jgi:hypothetical protein